MIKPFPINVIKLIVLLYEYREKYKWISYIKSIKNIKVKDTYSNYPNIWNNGIKRTLGSHKPKKIYYFWIN